MPNTERPVTVERRNHTDRRANSPKFREWIDGLSVLGKILVTVSAVLGTTTAAVGAKVVLTETPPATDAAELTNRLGSLEKRTEALGVVVGGSVRSQCLKTSDAVLFYLRLPCDSLMREFPGWRAMRDSTLRLGADR
jgi:hypothetical protein